MKKEELAGRVNDAHRKIINVLNVLTDEQAARVGLNAEWSVKDLIVHLIAWKERGVAEFDLMAKGIWQPQKLEMAAIHEFNAAAVNRRRADLLADVRADFERAHAQINGLIAVLPDEVEEASPAFRAVNGTNIRHVEYHAAQLAEWHTKLSAGA